MHVLQLESAQLITKNEKANIIATTIKRDQILIEQLTKSNLSLLLDLGSISLKKNEELHEEECAFS